MDDNKGFDNVTYKEVYDFIYGPKKDRIELFCSCLGSFEHIGIHNYNNYNYDVLQSKDCKCYGKPREIPFLDKNYANVRFGVHLWPSRKDSPLITESHLFKTTIVIPPEPVYKMIEVEEGARRYTKSVELNQAEKVRYYSGKT